MPASPSRPSTTIARRCAVFCTDRILHGRFCLSKHTENGDLGSPARHSALCLRSSPCGGLLPAQECHRQTAGDGPLSPHSGPPLRLASRARFPVAVKLRSEQSEIDDVEPAE